MDSMSAPIGGDAQMVACPNCGNRQAMSGSDARCDRCGTLLEAAGGGEGGIDNPRPVGVADPSRVPPPIVSGGIGGTSDGTQVTHRVSSAVPGKPMAPIADDPAGHSTEEGQAMGTPSSPAPSVRGGGA